MPAHDSAPTLPRFPAAFSLCNDDPDDTRRRLKDYFCATFDRYESLFETLACDAAWYQPAIGLRHPLIFYFGHTATFFVNKMLLARLIERRINPAFESGFAVGVDEMGWDDMNEADRDWPAIDAVRAYRKQVRARVCQVIDTAPLDGPIDWDSPWWAIIMGIEHERIHLETSSVLIRQQRLEYVQPHPDWRPCTDRGAAPTNELMPVTAGKVELGRPRGGCRYGWDNEYGHHEGEVAAFEASRYLASNGEFLAFVEAGGYAKPEYWEDEGRAWLDFSKAEHPSFWRRAGEAWTLRLLTEEVAMPWNWPVEVNFHEAKAFCNWKAAHTGRPVRLPSEDEWHRLLEAGGIGHDPDNANIKLRHGASSMPVDAFAQGDFFDIIGNVWQWTETPIYPFEGFQVQPLYDDFTTPTFDSRHNIIKGGSWIASGNEASPDSRYAFRRHFFQHAGFRYIVSEQTEPVPPSHYETDELLSQYAEFHYGDEYFALANFSQTLAKLAIAAIGAAPRRHALDLGCASGRASFELARHFDRVTGVDFSARFINQGVTLARGECLRYALADEGDLVIHKDVNLTDLDLAAVAHKVSFHQGDACNLKPQLSGFDLIFAANLIDRLYDPGKFLDGIHERLNAGGWLMIASPCTWLPEHTPRDKWLGGFVREGEPVHTVDGLHQHLDARFQRIGEPCQVPFVIRETRRKFQHTLSEVTFWQRRD